MDAWALIHAPSDPQKPAHWSVSAHALYIGYIEQEKNRAGVKGRWRKWMTKLLQIFRWHSQNDKYELFSYQIMADLDEFLATTASSEEVIGCQGNKAVNVD